MRVTAFWSRKRAGNRNWMEALFRDFAKKVNPNGKGMWTKSSGRILGGINKKRILLTGRRKKKARGGEPFHDFFVIRLSAFRR